MPRWLHGELRFVAKVSGVSLVGCEDFLNKRVINGSCYSRCADRQR